MQSKEKPLYSVRQALLWLAVACFLPGLLGAALVMGYQHQQSRHELEQQTILTARALVQSVDNHLFKIEAAAFALSNSESIARGDQVAFYREASETMRLLGGGSNAVLRDASGRQILNTAVAFGSSLGVQTAPLQVQGVFESGRPTISNLFIGPVRQRPLMSVDVPVMLKGQVAYALGISVLPEHFNDLLAAHKLPSDWFTGVLDQNGVYVGRTRQPDLYVGQRASPSLLKQLDRSGEAAGNTLTPEGAEVVAFHSRSPITGWTVAIGVPRDTFTQGLFKTTQILAASMAVLFGAGALLAWLISKRIADAFQALSRQAAALGAGRYATMPPPRLKEAAEVAAVLARAASMLDERETTLQDSEARFKAIVDNMAQLAWMSDQCGKILWFNQRWYEYTGTQQTDLVAGRWLTHLHPEHEARARQRFEMHLQAGQPWEDTFALQGSNGEYRWFLSRALPLRDGAGHITNWFGTHTDVTPQLEAQQALHEADVRKDEFIALLAHELRNPLAPVRTAAEILQRADLQEPGLVRACKVIERQVTHMARLIDGLLDVARIASGKLILESATCDFAKIARHTAEDYQSSMQASGLDFDVHTPSQPIWVHGDGVRLAQMIGNLLNNAARFTERGGRVEVRVESDSALRQVIVQVRDTGLGLKPELIQRLFTPFSQGAQDLARSKGGLGLGLALTKALAELHGGSLHVESEGLGLGATFTLRLPLDSTAGVPAAPLTLPPRPHHHRRVLLIEDNEDAARTLGELLELSGNEVALAFDGESGIAIAHRFEPEVVISDIGLPGGADGYEVARQIRADEKLKDVVLVALSGYTDEKSRARGREAGFHKYLFKPVNIEELEDVLDSAGT